MKNIILITLFAFSAQSFAADILQQTLHQFAGEYTLKKGETAKKRMECRNHFNIYSYGKSQQHIEGGLWIKKTRHQQYIKDPVYRTGKNLSNDPSVVLFKSYKAKNLIYTKFDSKVSDYGRLTHIVDGEWGNIFWGFRSENTAITIDFKNEGLLVSFHRVGNKKKAKLGKKLATCLYTL